MVKIPYDKQIKQVQANGKRRFKCWNGFIPEGFELAPADRVPEQMKKSWEAILPTI
jgi:apocytochrome f